MVLLAAAASALGAAPSPSSVPYSLPVVLPPAVSSPAVDPTAPYTATVRSLITQLETGASTAQQAMRQASHVLSSSNVTPSTCHNLGTMATAKTTVPRVSPLCFSDGLGINVIDGPNVRRTTGMPSLVMLGASFDEALANAYAQVEGREGRNLMVTGLLGPQADTDVFVNWMRGLHTPGEDPWLNGLITAAEVNGMQGQGLMAQVKHFAVYNGSSERFPTEVQDQALHELLLPPYEAALGNGGAASIMCSYALASDPSPALPRTVPVLIGDSPFGATVAQTWPLAETHQACEHPLLLTYVLRNLWHSIAFVDSDYGAVHSASGILQGADREDPGRDFFGDKNPRDGALDASSSTCSNIGGQGIDCGAVGARRVAGIPGAGCPSTGCSVGNAAANGTLPLAVFNQSLARILYQEERFGLLGCDNESADCRNPGGVGGNRTGLAPLESGPATGTPVIGTRNGDAAVVERVAEEGAVLLKNAGRALPIRAGDLVRGVAVSGPGAEYLIANPTNEGALGFVDRNATNPLQQLQALSGRPDAFHYVPANAPTGQSPRCAWLSPAASAPRAAPSGCGARSGLALTMSGADSRKLDRSVDHTVGSLNGPLAGGHVYHWSGWLYVPSSDAYVFRFQHSRSVGDDRLTFRLDGREAALTDAVSFYYGQYYGSQPVDVDTTNAGYIEAGLRNRQCASSLTPARGTSMPAPPGPGEELDDSPLSPAAAGPGAGGPPPTQRAAAGPAGACEAQPSVGWHRIEMTLDAASMPADSAVSVRFGLSRADGDIRDAAQSARGRALALVFVNDHDRNVAGGMPGASQLSNDISSLAPDQVKLIRAVAAANPRTVVILNTGTPVIVSDWIGLPAVQALLNMWLTGQEGGTATARLLLGQANPSGHTPLSWPMNSGDTVSGYAQPRPLYQGDSAGAHPERLGGLPGGGSRETQGIFAGYRFYDALEIPVQFPFGFGLSYSRFRMRALAVQDDTRGGADVAFDLTNDGNMAGAEVAQVYVGPGPARGGVQQAVRALRGIARVELAPHETRHVTVHLDARAFQYWSEQDQRWQTLEGVRRISVGDADRPSALPLSAEFKVGD